MTRSETTPPELSNPLRRVRWMPFALLLVVISISLLGGFRHFTSLDAVIELRDRFHSLVAVHEFAAMALYLAAYVGTVALSLPGSIILTVTAGLMFGWLKGGIIALIAATLGASIVYGITRNAVGEALISRAGPQIGKIRDGFCRNALSYMLFLRLVPAFPFCVVNVVPAIIGVPFRTYILGTFLGIMPACFAYSSAGAGLDGAISAAKIAQARCLAAGSGTQCQLAWSVGDLITPELKIALLLLSALSLLPAGIEAWRRRRGN